MSSHRKRVIGAGIMLCFAVFLGGIVISRQPVTQSIRPSILGRTNDASGTAEVVVEVVNHGWRMQNYAYWAEVRNGYGWTTATNWDFERPGRMYWIKSHDTNQLTLQAPEGASTWRLKFLEMKQPSKLEWRWYALVRRTGLKQFGLRDSPEPAYFFTEEIRH